MLNLPIPEQPRRLPDWVDRDVLLEWVRNNAPDLRIVKVRLEDGRRACGARFTFRGELVEVEAVQADDLPDPDDAIVRRAAWILYRRMGIPMPLDDADRRRLEESVLEAARAGNTELADKLGLELAMMNEGMGGVVPLRSGFER